MMNESELQRLFEAEGLADGHQFEGAGAPDHARKALRAACAGTHAQIYFGKADFSGVLARYANIAGERDFQSAAYGMSIQRSDHQLRRLLEARESLVGVQAEIIFEFRRGG